MAIPVRRQFSNRDPYWFDDYFVDNHPRRALDQDFATELEPDHFDQDEFLLPPPPSWFRQAMLSHFNNRSSFFNNRLGRLRRRGSIGGIGGPSLPSDVNFGRGRMQVFFCISQKKFMLIIIFIANLLQVYFSCCKRSFLTSHTLRPKI